MSGMCLNLGNIVSGGMCGKSFLNGIQSKNAISRDITDTTLKKLKNCISTEAYVFHMIYT